MNIFKRKKALSFGAHGEEVAIKYLRECGYTILASNFFNTTGRRIGEIDIIAKEGEEIVFVEVKTRGELHKRDPLPEESITRAKLYKLNKAASFYISKNNLFNASYRFDAITLLVDKQNGRATLRHLKNIFL